MIVHHLYTIEPICLFAVGADSYSPCYSLYIPDKKVVVEFYPEKGNIFRYDFPEYLKNAEKIATNAKDKPGGELVATIDLEEKTVEKILSRLKKAKGKIIHTYSPKIEKRDTLGLVKLLCGV